MPTRTQSRPLTTVGGFFGYIRGENEQKDASSKIDTDSLVTGIYGEYRMDQWRANARLSYTRIEADSRRNLLIAGVPRTADADYVDQTVSIEAEVARIYELQDKLWVEPYVGAVALRQFLDDFTETGAGAANLTRDSDRVLTGNTEVGLRLAAELAIDDSTLLTPQFGVAWKRHIGSRTNNSTLHFAGGPDFVVQGVPEDRDSFNVTLGTAASFSDQWQAFALYSRTVSSNQDEHSFVLGTRYEW